MICKKVQGLLAFLFLFLAGCGLRFGEKAPPAFKYKLSSQADYCSQLNYREEFDSYFLEEQKENYKDNVGGERLGKALYCLSSKIRAAKKWIDHERLEKQELINLLNQDFVKTKEVQPIIDHIIPHLDNYILIKDIFIYLIEKKSEHSLIPFSYSCQKQPKKEFGDKTVFSKAETLIFTRFLEEMADFFISVEKSGYEALNNFIKPHSKVDPRFLSRSKSTQLDSFKAYWALFLIEYFKKDFPGYSHFISNNFFEKEDILQPLWDIASWPPDSSSFSDSRLSPPDKQAVSWPPDSSLFPDSRLPPASSPQTLTSLTNFSLPPSDKWTAQNVKYMMLNIFIMRALFLALDGDQDSVLSPLELEPLSCLIASAASLIIWPKTKDQREFIKNLYHPKAVANYIVQYQKIPSAISPRFIKYRLVNQPEITKDLSYADVSRLISLLILELFNKIQNPDPPASHQEML